MMMKNYMLVESGKGIQKNSQCFPSGKRNRHEGFSIARLEHRSLRTAMFMGTCPTPQQLLPQLHLPPKKKSFTSVIFTYLPCGKLTWQMKRPMFNRKYIDSIRVPFPAYLGLDLQKIPSPRHHKQRRKTSAACCTLDKKKAPKKMVASTSANAGDVRSETFVAPRTKKPTR